MILRVGIEVLLVASNDFANLFFLHLPDIVLLVAIRVVLDVIR